MGKEKKKEGERKKKRKNEKENNVCNYDIFRVGQKYG